MSTDKASRMRRRRQAVGTGAGFTLQICAVAFLLTTLLFVSPARAADEGFYKGRTINFVIGYSVGNGYDSYARLVARHMGKHLPGHPTIVVQNMPGAGSLTAINYLYNVAPKDGTVLGIIDQAAPLVQVLYPSKVHGDVSKFNWIGRVTDNASVLYAWHTAPVKTIKGAFKHELIVSASGQNSRMIMNLMKNLLGLKLRILTGYKGAGESRLAMERGEVQALTQPWPVLRSEESKWLSDGTIRILLQIGVESNPELKKVPLIVDLARTDEERRILSIMAGSSKIGRAVMSPPGQPADRVAALRAAFDATMKDKDFLTDAKKSGLDLNPLSGTALQQVVEDMASVPPPLAAKIKKLVASDN